jgi:hypothetical protein
MALTAALKAAHAAVDDAAASPAAAGTLENQFRNTTSQLPPVTRSGDAQPPPPPTARPSTNMWTLLRGLPRQLDDGRALLRLLIDAGTSSAPPVRD